MNRLAVGIVIGVIVFLVVALERAKWRECRRHHPAWYCVVGGGR